MPFYISTCRPYMWLVIVSAHQPPPHYPRPISCILSACHHPPNVCVKHASPFIQSSPLILSWQQVAAIIVWLAKIIAHSTINILYKTIRRKFIGWQAASNSFCHCLLVGLLCVPLLLAPWHCFTSISLWWWWRRRGVDGSAWQLVVVVTPAAVD